jgi:hypothetical protein
MRPRESRLRVGHRLRLPAGRLGLVDMDTGEIHSRAAYEWRTTAHGARASLVACHDHLSGFLRMGASFPPATIAFEMPTGKHRNPSLVMHTGVIVLAAAQATGLHPWKAGVTEWKKVVQGHGQATKDSLIPWCASLGHVTDDVDRAVAKRMSKESCASNEVANVR